MLAISSEKLCSTGASSGGVCVYMRPTALHRSIRYTTTHSVVEERERESNSDKGRGVGKHLPQHSQVTAIYALHSTKR